MYVVIEDGDETTVVFGVQDFTASDDSVTVHFPSDTEEPPRSFDGRVTSAVTFANHNVPGISEVIEDYAQKAEIEIVLSPAFPVLERGVGKADIDRTLVDA